MPSRLIRGVRESRVTSADCKSDLRLIVSLVRGRQVAGFSSARWGAAPAFLEAGCADDAVGYGRLVGAHLQAALVEREQEPVHHLP